MSVLVLVSYTLRKGVFLTLFEAVLIGLKWRGHAAGKRSKYISPCAFSYYSHVSLGLSTREFKLECSVDPVRLAA